MKVLLPTLQLVVVRRRFLSSRSVQSVKSIGHEAGWVELDERTKEEEKDRNREQRSIPFVEMMQTRHERQSFAPSIRFLKG